MFATALVALVSASLAAAQHQTIQVGATSSTSGGIFQFIPPTVNATEGSVITFNFSGVPGFHSVAQSAFDNPCQPLQGGFDSGFVGIDLSGTVPSEFPTWNLTITNASQPIWFFCQQLAPQPHCQAGMVGGINVASTGDKSFSAFQSAARASKGTPGQNIGGLVGVGASASAPPSPLTIAGVTGLNNPTGATAASGAAATTGSGSSSSSGAGSSPSRAPSSGSVTVSNSLLVVLASFFGILAA